MLRKRCDNGGKSVAALCERRREEAESERVWPDCQRNRGYACTGARGSTECTRSTQTGHNTEQQHQGLCSTFIDTLRTLAHTHTHTSAHTHTHTGDEL